MAKKVKLPLDMGNDVFVRTLDELKENYNSEKAVESFLDGRLLTWLDDRYYEDEAARVRELSEQRDRDKLAVKLGEIFGVKVETEVDIDVLEIRREKLEKLRKITSDDNILENVDYVAFSQEDLGDLLDEGAEVIYLCGGSFRIPLSVENVRYIGVNSPVITIKCSGTIDPSEKGIAIERCTFDEDTKAKLTNSRCDAKPVKKEAPAKADEIEYYNRPTTNPQEVLDIDYGTTQADSFISPIRQELIDRFLCMLYDIDDISELPTKIFEIETNMAHKDYSCSIWSLLRRYPNTFQLKIHFYNYTNESMDSNDVLKVLQIQSEETKKLIDKTKVLSCNEFTAKAFGSGSIVNLTEKIPIISGTGYGDMSLFIPINQFSEFYQRYMCPIIVAPCKEKITEAILRKIIDEGKKFVKRYFGEQRHFFINFQSLLDDVSAKESFTDGLKILILNAPDDAGKMKIDSWYKTPMSYLDITSFSDILK